MGELGEEIVVEEEEVNSISLKDLSKKLDEFAKARDWEKYHSPKNLLLAMVGEVGELSEIFQWRGEVDKGLPNWEESDKEHLGEELSDVLLYLIRLAYVCGIDLAILMYIIHSKWFALLKEITIMCLRQSQWR